MRTMAYSILEGSDTNPPLRRLFTRFIVALIVLNGAAVILESNQLLYAQFGSLFNAFELFSVAVFSVEYICRLWVIPDRKKYRAWSPWKARVHYIFTPMALVDLLAILPFYLALFIPIDLRYLRLFRLLRLLKLSHYFDGLSVFTTVLKREAGAIAGALLTMIVIVIISACLMFSVENAAQPGQFDSIAQSVWWAVVTLTTVGYGDITPVSFAGKLLGMVIMFAGVGTMALPAGIMAARFSEELQSRRELMRSRVMDALKDGVMDPAEKKAIRAMQEQLGLSTQDVHRIVRVQRQHMKRFSYCPHCGESLDPEEA